MNEMVRVSFGCTGNWFLQLSRTPAVALGRQFLMLAFLFLAASQVQAHEILTDGDPHNDWIQGLANSDNVPCCGNNDCYPLPAGSLQIAPDGAFKVEVGGYWFSVPEQNLL